MRPADRATLLGFLRRVAHRRALIAALNGAAAGLIVALILVVAPTLGWGGRIAVAAALAAAGGAAAAFVARKTPVANALDVERRAPQCHNVVVTASELADLDTPSYVADVVLEEAARTTRALDISALFPSRRSVVRLLGAAAVLAVALALPGAKSAVTTATTGDDRGVSVDRVEVVVTPPPYTHLPVRTLRDPSRVEAVAGSKLQLTMRAHAASAAIETLTGQLSATGPAANTFAADLVADDNGYIAIEPVGSDGTKGARRIIGLSVTPDASPRVKITAPAKDLLLPDATRTVDVTVEASDDFGLASLKLRYTKVAGSGEQFTFTEGEVPLTITRDSAQAWHARAQLVLPSFKLEQGDMLVYRAVAADERPGAPPAESDTYIVEITAPGGVAAAGFTIDDERDRYGLSQQMIIVKTQRLLARRASMAPDSVKYEAMLIAAEQRSVRAEFVFMMGGELEDDVVAAAGLNELNETAEAEAEGDILAGRLANRGRLDMVRAIRSMSRAATGLTAGELDKALTDEKSALTYLQGAFARARYILRALTERERLDMTRRLSGSLVGALSDARPEPRSAVNQKTASLRRVLADIAAVSGATELGRAEAARAAQLAEEVLRADPSAESLQHVATQLTNASRSIGQTQFSAARRALTDAAMSLSAAIRRRLADAPQMPRSLELQQLNGALIDALTSAGAAK